MSAKSSGSHPSPGEDVKQKFREALERKQARGGRANASEGEASKVHDAHGPAKVQHMFRRKSG